MNTLPDTDNYAISVVPDPEHDGVDCYAVINRHTQVREYYDNLITRTYQAMIQMEEKYQDMEAMIAGHMATDEFLRQDSTNH